jgi:glycerol-3-phosphate acyltransferase PlsY
MLAAVLAAVFVRGHLRLRVGWHSAGWSAKDTEQGDIRTVIAALVVVAAYALGTFPTAVLVGRRGGFDPTQAGSGNPGTSNAFRLGGRRAGAIVLAGDLGKGVLATLVGLAVGGPRLALAAGAAAVLGHVVPITRPRSGGKGVATALGVVLVLDPWLGLVGVVVWIAALALTRTAALASITMVSAIVGVALLASLPAWEIAGCAGIAFLVVVRHRGNLTRLVWGRRGGEVVLPLLSDEAHVHE